MLKNKAYSPINILGLSIGMAVELIITLWIFDELTFDHYHQNHTQLAQVMTTQTFNGETGTGQAVAMPLGKELRTKYASDFKHVWRHGTSGTFLLSVIKKREDGMWVEPVFPSMVSLKMLKGSQSVNRSCFHKIKY